MRHEAGDLGWGGGTEASTLRTQGVLASDPTPGPLLSPGLWKWAGQAWHGGQSMNAWRCHSCCLLPGRPSVPPASLGGPPGFPGSWLLGASLEAHSLSHAGQLTCLKAAATHSGHTGSTGWSQSERGRRVRQPTYQADRPESGPLARDLPYSCCLQRAPVAPQLARAPVPGR